MTANGKPVTEPLRVAFMRNPHDQQVAILGAAGFATDFIAKTTGLTPCQVTYRLGLAHIKRAHYRHGTNHFATWMAEAAMRPQSRPRADLLAELRRVDAERLKAAKARRR